MTSHCSISPPDLTAMSLKMNDFLAEESTEVGWTTGFLSFPFPKASMALTTSGADPVLFRPLDPDLGSRICFFVSRLSDCGSNPTFLRAQYLVAVLWVKNTFFGRLWQVFVSFGKRGNSSGLAVVVGVIVVALIKIRSCSSIVFKQTSPKSGHFDEKVRDYHCYGSESDPDPGGQKMSLKNRKS
jgi:hypothetical protein